MPFHHLKKEQVPNTALLHKNLQNSFYKRIFVSVYHLLNQTEMKNTTHETQKKTGFLARMRQKLTERKRRIMRLIELKRLQRIRKKTVPGYTYCKNCGTKLEGMYCHCCGQYALDIYQPFWKYFKQYFENVYQFDSKIWQTLWLMFTRRLPDQRVQCRENQFLRASFPPLHVHLRGLFHPLFHAGF